MSKKIWLKIWPTIIITTVIFSFHSRLLLPSLSFYVTPDYGRSDAWHLSIANKFYFAQELKKNHIPIWNPHIGTGYPIFAEGQTGTLFLPNLLLFRFIPFALAYNLDLIFTFVIAALGMYMFSRSINFNKLASTYSAIIFSLGGFFVVRIQHLHLIQAACILPWLFWTTNEYIKKRNITYLALLTIFLSQQVFAGFPQLVLYGLVGLYIFLFLLREINIYKLITITLFIALGFGIGAVQLLPTYELLKESTRNNFPVSNNLNTLPFTPTHLLQFINPFILGSPKDASFPLGLSSKWGIYWENLVYIGIIPLFLSIFAMRLMFSKKEKHKDMIRIFTVMSVIGILLALGSATPLRPIFSIPPFSFFRVPAKFLLLVQFSLPILAGIVLSKLNNKKILIYALLIISLIDLFYFFYNYNPTDNSNKWLQDPQTVTILKKYNPERIVSLGQALVWNQHFLNDGWKNMDYFYFARNGLNQNSNLIFGINQLQTYESLITQRQANLNSAFFSGIKLDENNINMTTNSANILRATNVDTIISPFNLENENYQKIGQTDSYQNVRFNVYRDMGSHSRTYIVTDYKLATTDKDFQALAAEPSFDPLKITILEKDPGLNQNTKTKAWSTRIVKDSGHEITILANLDGDGLLILADSYYPGWKAYVNKQEVQIYAANMNQKAIYLNKGIHTIIFKYQPSSIKTGSIITLISLLTLVCIYTKYRNNKSKKTALLK